MGRNQLVGEDVVRLEFTVRNDNGWSHSQIGAHFDKSKYAYSEESLSPKVVQKRKTNEVEDGVIVGMGKHLFKESYEKLTAVLKKDNMCPVFVAQVKKVVSALKSKLWSNFVVFENIVELRCVQFASQLVVKTKRLLDSVFRTGGVCCLS